MTTSFLRRPSCFIGVLLSFFSSERATRAARASVYLTTNVKKELQVQETKWSRDRLLFPRMSDRERTDVMFGSVLYIT